MNPASLKMGEAVNFPVKLLAFTATPSAIFTSRGRISVGTVVVADPPPGFVPTMVKLYDVLLSLNDPVHVCTDAVVADGGSPAGGTVPHDCTVNRVWPPIGFGVAPAVAVNALPRVVVVAARTSVSATVAARPRPMLSFSAPCSLPPRRSPLAPQISEQTMGQSAPGSLLSACPARGPAVAARPLPVRQYQTAPARIGPTGPARGG